MELITIFSFCQYLPLVFLFIGNEIYRERTGWLEKILKRILAGNGSVSDIDLLVTVANQIEGNTICALGEAAAWPVRFTVTRFRDYFEARVSKEVNLQVANKVHSMRETARPLAEVKN
jgi:NADH-quinone oxidoreductase subunit F